MTRSIERNPTPHTRVYKGQTLQVQVLADGFEFEGKFYDSLGASPCVKTPNPPWKCRPN